MNKIPEEIFTEFIRHLTCHEVYDFMNVFEIPKSIINLQLVNGHTLLECALIVDTYCENIELIRKLVQNGADPLAKSSNNTTAFQALICYKSLNFIDDDKFNEVYNIMFPGDLSFTRSGKCYSGVLWSVIH